MVSMTLCVSDIHRLIRIGSITFGQIDASKYRGPLKYNKVVPVTNGHWAIALDNVGMGKDQAGITGRNAYIDTGTSFVFAPKEDVAKFHAMVPGAASTTGESYTVPCSSQQDATFTFAGTTYTVSAQDWVGPAINGTCTSNIFGKAIIADSWLLGGTFLKNVHAVFDIDNAQIGMQSLSFLS